MIFYYIFYYKDDNFDIDFVLFREGNVIPIQVCYELNDKNYKREIEDLEKFIKTFKLEKAVLVYFEKNIEISSDKIDLLSLKELEKIF